MFEFEENFDSNVDDQEKVYNIRHRCYFFSKDLVEFVKECQYEFRFRSLFEQLIRAGTSIGANVVESKAGSSFNDWKKYITIALKSANETKYWLCLIRDTMEIDQEKVNRLVNEAVEISNILGAILSRSSENKQIE